MRLLLLLLPWGRVPSGLPRCGPDINAFWWVIYAVVEEDDCQKVGTGSYMI
jgi:hypothetical protein